MTHWITPYGTAVVTLHAIVVFLHALAHRYIPVPATPTQAIFIVTVIVTAPIVAMVLLWTSFRRTGAILLHCSMLGALIFGVYNHFIAIGPDRVSQIPPSNWQLLFQVTAVLLTVTEAVGCGIGAWVLAMLPSKRTVV